MANNIHVDDGDWELFRIFGRDALFSNYRIDRSTVPKQLYAYDLRDRDDLSGIPSELKSRVTANHMGTVLVKAPFENADDGIIINLEDYDFVGGECDVRDFIDGNYDMDADYYDDV